MPRTVTRPSDDDAVVEELLPVAHVDEMSHREQIEVAVVEELRPTRICDHMSSRECVELAGALAGAGIGEAVRRLARAVVWENDDRSQSFVVLDSEGDEPEEELIVHLGTKVPLRLEEVETTGAIVTEGGPPIEVRRRERARDSIVVLAELRMDESVASRIGQTIGRTGDHGYRACHADPNARNVVLTNHDAEAGILRRCIVSVGPDDRKAEGERRRGTT